MRAVGAFWLVMSLASTATAAVVDPPFWTGRETASSIAELNTDRIRRALNLVDRMVARKGRRTIENTLRPFDRALFELDCAEGQTSLLQNVHPDAALREAAEKASQKAAAAKTSLMLNRGVYAALAAMSLQGADAATRHYVDKLLRDFRRGGVDKDDATRRRVAELQGELVLIGQEFARNVRDDRRTIYVREAGELAGLPQDYIERHRPDENGVIRISTDYVDVTPVLTFARSDALRRAVYMEFFNRGCPANQAVLDRLLARRHELAQRLGFASWADYATADKMTGSAKTASAFIDDIAAAAAPRAQKEYERLLARKRQEQPEATAVHAWESSYWQEILRKSDYQLDSQKVRAYFPARRVKQGMLDVTGRLFGLSYRKVEGAPVWHPSVECWEAAEDGRVIGRFYVDLHPRPDKYGHAALFGIRPGVRGEHVPELALVGNMPGGDPQDPGLMDQKDVETLFHEFGHLLHVIFAGSQAWTGITGISTESDFIEAPSQLLQEWTYSPKVLATFARHYQTDEPIAAELVQKMRKAAELAKALNVRRQAVLARISLAYHDRPPSEVDTDAIARQAAESLLPFPYVEGTHLQCSFQHLDTYSAYYYAYMWSLVIAKDLFSSFDREDLLEPKVARRYRDTILAPGGAAPAAALIEGFLGRPFNKTAWERWLNE